MSPSLRIGVIGYGYWGPNLVRNFAAGPRTKVVAIAEQNAHRRQVAQSQYPYIRIVEEAAALIADPDVDAVAIATPIFTHFELAEHGRWYCLAAARGPRRWRVLGGWSWERP